MRLGWALLTLAACHHTPAVENIAVPREGIALALYDTYGLVDDRRWVEPKDGRLVLDDIDPAAALPSLVIEPFGGALRVGACHREDLPAYARAVTCDVTGSGRTLVRVLYVTPGLVYRPQHEVRMSNPERVAIHTRYAIQTPSWHRHADAVLYDGVPGGDHAPREVARGGLELDGSIGVIAVPDREVKARLRRVFDGAAPQTADVVSSDIAWGEGSHDVVWVWLELADARIPPGPVHAILDLPNELARVSEIPAEGRKLRDAEAPDAPSRLPVYTDEDLHGARQRWHDFADNAELADRFLMSVTNTGDEPREVWIEEHLRAAKQRRVVRPWPKKPGLHGEILRDKVLVRPGKTERIGFTVDYYF